MEQVKGTDFYINSLDSSGLHLDCIVSKVFALNDTDTVYPYIKYVKKANPHEVIWSKSEDCREFSVCVCVGQRGRMVTTRVQSHNWECS